MEFLDLEGMIAFDSGDLEKVIEVMELLGDRL